MVAAANIQGTEQADTEAIEKRPRSNAVMIRTPRKNYEVCVEELNASLHISFPTPKGLLPGQGGRKKIKTAPTTDTTSIFISGLHLRRTAVEEDTTNARSSSKHTTPAVLNTALATHDSLISTSFSLSYPFSLSFSLQKPLLSYPIHQTSLRGYRQTLILRRSTLVYSDPNTARLPLSTDR